MAAYTAAEAGLFSASAPRWLGDVDSNDANNALNYIVEFKEDKKFHPRIHPQIYPQFIHRCRSTFGGVPFEPRETNPCLGLYLFKFQ